MEHLSDENRALVQAGDLTVHEGQDPMKPVLRDKKGHLVKGTGITPNHIDTGQMSKENAWKRTNDYASWLASKMSLDPEKGPEDKESAEWWWERAQEAAMMAYVEITCPSCDHRFEHRAGKPDGNLIFRVIELVTGKAKQRTDVNIKMEEIHRILSETVDVDELEVHALTPEVVAERRKIIEAEFTDG